MNVYFFFLNKDIIAGKEESFCPLSCVCSADTKEKSRENFCFHDQQMGLATWLQRGSFFPWPLKTEDHFLKSC